MARRRNDARALMALKADADRWPPMPKGGVMPEPHG